MTKLDLPRTDPPGEPAFSGSRARVLAVLQAAAAPMGVLEVAAMVGLHANTTRFHLDALIADGLVRRDNEERDSPGRPRGVYSVTAEGDRAGARSFRLLAEVLLDYLSANAARPRQSAIEAGEAWGRAVARRDPDQPADPAAATDELLRVLAEIGFAPEAVSGSDGPDGRQVVVHHCPFREVVDGHSEVVCGVHLGIVRGVLAELDAPVRAERIDPLVEPNRCVTHLTARG